MAPALTLTDSRVEFRIHPAWRCFCGTAVRAFDFAIVPDAITHTCSQCHARLLAIELHQRKVEKT